MPKSMICHCGTKVEASDDSVEKRATCPTCGSVVFFVGLPGSGPIDTYAIAKYEPPKPEAKPKPAEVAQDEGAPPPDWLDRYKASAETKKGEHKKTIDLILKAATADAAADPYATALYLAVTQPWAETTVAALAKVASTGHPVYAPIAVSFLEHIGPSEAAGAQQVLRMLGEVQNPQVAQLLSTCLRKLGPTPVVQVRSLIELLTSKHTSLFAWAAQCLGQIGSPAKSAVDGLLKSLKVANHELRLAVIDALGSIGRDADRVIPVLMQALKHQSADYRAHAAAALGRFGSSANGAVAALQPVASDQDAAVRQAAAEALKKIATAAATPKSNPGTTPAPAPPAPETLVVPCGCGKKLRVKPELAGRRVKCPACGKGVLVPPAPSAATDEKVCPSCLATVRATVLLCVHCGLDFRTGKQHATNREAAVEESVSP
ncbi:MAG: HEAT repeat domain-containing protein [Planctomycetaceae bacterium]